MPSTPSIHDHAAIGDGRSVALVARDGTIDWLCWPRFESPAIFAALLDPGRGGGWRICAPRSQRVTRAYVEATNVLETRFETPEGVAVLTDAMAVEPSNTHELLRRVVCERGRVDIEVELALRPAFGRRQVRFRSAGVLGMRADLGSQLIALHAERRMEIDEDVVRARFTLQAGEAARFSLTFDDDIATIPLLGEHADARIAAACRWWQAWVAQLRYEGPYRDLVVRSLLATKLLAFAPSGAIVAAATTSLPERVGGDLNWDYRFCWLRDASFTARAFDELGFPDDASAFCQWMLHATRLTRPELRILYDVYGVPPRDEQILGELTGYRGSRPVRVRNAASTQLQLDCYGEVLDAAVAVHARGGIDMETQAMLADFGRYVLAHWHLPDSGIWEERGEPLHRTHSRVLCWVALDRLLALRRQGLVRRLDADALAEACEAIQADVAAHGWNPAIASYTEVFGADEVDAGLLLLPYYGFERATSPRMIATARRVEERLRAGPGLYWRNERGPRIGEGAFGICSAWMVDYLVRANRGDDARSVLEAFAAHANDVGLFGEEVDIETREALGNFPQAYTHVGMLAAALVVSQSTLARGAA